jgi:small subunit ribosomal protein S20
MANTRSAAKRARQTTKRSLRNHSVVTRLRTIQKQVRSAAPTADQIRAVISAIDKAAKRRIIHRNAATRRKARLNKALVAAK